MFSELRGIAERMTGLGRGFDPARVSGEDAAAIADVARVIARAAGSIEARAAARADMSIRARRTWRRHARELTPAETDASERFETTAGPERDRLDDTLARMERRRAALEVDLGL